MSEGAGQARAGGAGGRGDPRGARPDAPIQSLYTSPAGCLVMFGAMALIALALGTVALGIFVPGYRSTPVYEQAMTLVNTHQRAEALLGHPIRETGLIRYLTQFNQLEGEGTRRNLSLRVAGPLGEGTLTAEGVEEDGRVNVEQASLVLNTGEIIRLRRYQDFRPDLRPSGDGVPAFPRGGDTLRGKGAGR